MSPLPVIRACPQCKDPLVTITHEEISALACRGCGGTWLENETMTRVVYALDESADAVGDDAAKMARMPFPPHADAPPCPMCHAPMRTEMLGGTDVEADICDEHGTWLDRGELQTVLHELIGAPTTRGIEHTTRCISGEAASSASGHARGASRADDRAVRRRPFATRARLLRRRQSIGLGHRRRPRTLGARLSFAMKLSDYNGNTSGPSSRAAGRCLDRQPTI